MFNKTGISDDTSFPGALFAPYKNESYIWNPFVSFEYQGLTTISHLHSQFNILRRCLAETLALKNMFFWLLNYR